MKKRSDFIDKRKEKIVEELAKQRMKFNEKKDKILEDIRMIPDLPEKKHKIFDKHLQT